jgi:hypothetical protein
VAEKGEPNKNKKKVTKRINKKRQKETKNKTFFFLPTIEKPN